MTETLLDLRGLDSTRATMQEVPIGASYWPAVTTVQNYPFKWEAVDPNAVGFILSGSLASDFTWPTIQIVFSPEKQGTSIQPPKGADLLDWLRNQYVQASVKDVSKLTGDVLHTMVKYSSNLHQSEPRAVSDTDGDVNDRRERYARLSALLDEWASEPPEFDSRVGPLIEEALRESAPRHFPKD